ncbi:MAG TPA: hypothetical protein VHL57_05775 [Flavobacteriales bacterium]|jgi:hypothetical protein|nr:hypothetical protein [Flavobacteriales bacterium]
MENLRYALLISLSILLLVVLYRRFKRYVMMRDLPAPLHAELVRVEVMYHPTRLRVELSVPNDQEVFPAVLTEHHAPLHGWPTQAMLRGQHVLELPFEGRADGVYFFELATFSQRTERRFILREA